MKTYRLKCVSCDRYSQWFTRDEVLECAAAMRALDEKFSTAHMGHIRTLERRWLVSI